jgi:hypothetical protein
MGKKKINTIEMTRKIRDDHAKRLAGKTHAERIAFYREQARKLEKKLPVLLSEVAVAGRRKGDYSNVETNVKRIRERRATYKKRK